MKKRILCIIAAFCLMLCGLPAHADDNADKYISSVSVDPESGLVSLSGQIPQIDKATELSLVVLNPGKTYIDLESTTDGNFAEYINHFAQVKTNEDGTWNYSFVLSGKVGIYNVVLNYRKGTNLLTAEKYIYFVTKAAVEEAVKELNFAEDTDSVLEVLEKNADVYGIDKSEITPLNDETKKYTANYLISKKPFSADELEKLRVAFNESVAVGKLQAATDGDTFSKLLEENAVVYGIKDENLYKDFYAKLSSKGKSTLFARCSDIKNEKSLSGIKNILLDNIILTCVENSESWTGIHSLLIEGAPRMSLFDAEKYKSLSSTSAIDKIITGKRYETLDVLSKTLNTALKNGGQQVPGSRPSTGSSGGSGGVPAFNTEKEEDFPFDDMENAVWAKEAVKNLYEKGIVSGKGSKKFAPADSLTREEFAKIVCTALRLEGTGNSAFSDVNGSAWYARYVEAAYENGLIMGKNDGSFGVGETISRQDVCVILYRAYKSNLNGSKELDFADAEDISDYAKEGVSALYGSDIVGGIGNSMFAPLRGITRAEAAKIIYGIIK